MNELAKAALLEVNKIREALGLSKLDDLPKGYRIDGCNCPIAKSLPNINVSSKRLSFNNSGDYQKVANTFRIEESAFAIIYLEVDCPDIQKFIIDFDLGLIPEYDIDCAFETSGTKIFDKEILEPFNFNF